MVKVIALVTPYVCPALPIKMSSNQHSTAYGERGSALDKFIHVIQESSPSLRIEQLLECADDETRDFMERILKGKTVINAVQEHRKETKDVHYCEELVWKNFVGRPQFLFESYDCVSYSYMVLMLKQNSDNHFIHKHVAQMQMYMEILRNLNPDSEITGQIGLLDIDKLMDVEERPGILEYAVEQRKTFFKIYDHGTKWRRNPTLCSGISCAYKGRCQHSGNSK
jgi:hypothetical protein